MLSAVLFASVTFVSAAHRHRNIRSSKTACWKLTVRSISMLMKSNQDSLFSLMLLSVSLQPTGSSDIELKYLAFLLQMNVEL